VILLLAVAVGAAAGLARALLSGNSFTAPALRGIGWAIAAFIPQFLVFFFSPLQGKINQTTASIVLIGSLLLLLVFAWQNRGQRAFYLMGLGLVLNLAAIGLNGGLMPISPVTVSQLYPEDQLNGVEVGSQLGYTKDVVLPVEQTRAELLADRFLLPDWSPIPVAFSIGDVFIAIGAFWLLWQCGDDSVDYSSRSNQEHEIA
jgi:hypothetical protein